MALTKISTGGVKDDAASQAKIADEAVDEARLQISNAGSNGQFLQKQSGNTGGLTWAAVPSDNSKADTDGQDFSGVIALKGTDQLKFYDAGDISHYIHFKAPSLTANTTYTLPTADGSSGQYLKTDGSGNLSFSTVVPTTITVADESSDTSCNVLFTTAATGDLGPKTGTNLTFNSSTGELEADIIKDSKGDLRSIPQNTQGSAYELLAADAGKHILASGNITWVDSRHAAGDAITIVNNTAGNITITKGTTMYNTADGNNANRTLALRGMATILWASPTVAYISGSGLS